VLNYIEQINRELKDWKIEELKDWKIEKLKEKNG
jgi:hypothetical protein